MSAHILTTTGENVMTVRFNRPDKKNSVTMEMYAALADACRAADTNPKVRVLVFGAVGDVFCAGNDMKDFLTQSLDDSNLPVYDFMRTLSGLRKPVIAAVAGAAIGIGATMLMHCDFVYATPNARFQLPFVNLAIVPEFASSLLLARLIGARKASELLLLGESFTAERALADGFITGILPAEHLKVTITTKVRALAAQPPGALRETKRLLHADLADINARMDMENKALGERVSTPELKEAVQAFFEKRAPDYSKFE